MIGAKLVEQFLPGVSNLEGCLYINGLIILRHVQKELFPLGLVIRNSKVATNICSRAIAIEGLDAIIEIGCRHYFTFGPVRYLADYLVAKIGALRDLLDV